MMDQASKLRLQAWLDGEMDAVDLPEWERRAATDPEAKSIVAQLTVANQAFRQFESTIKVPASREFYWSGIERHIRQAEAPAPVQQPTESVWGAWFRRILVPAGTAALLLFAGWFTSLQFGLIGKSQVSALEGSLTSTGNFTYRDYSSGTTLVWLSYPAENEIAEYGGGFTLP